MRFRNTAISLAAASLLGACSDSPEDLVAERWVLLDQHCVDCHNDTEFTGGLSFEQATPADVSADPQTWERVVRKLRGSLMPPPGGTHPGAEEVESFVAALESELDAAAVARGAMPGHVVMHRLNRTEYATAVEDLLGLQVDAAELLPPDVASDGFDNVADALRVSPTFLDQYIAAARDISIQAVGDPDAAPTLADYRSSREHHTSHIDGLPLGTRGGMLVEHFFPADGEYVFNMNVSSEPGAELRAYPQGWLEYEHRAILTIDGVPVYQNRIGGPDALRAVDSEQIAAVGRFKDRFREIRVPVTAGYHRIGATFAARSFAESDYLLESFVPGEGIPDVPRMLGLQIVGPYDASGIEEPTVSRARIFTCYPETAAEERPCAERVLTRLATRAFRRPLTDQDLDTVLAFYDRGAAEGFERGIQMGLFSILASTKFLYRMEPGGPPADAPPGSAYPISDIELAWRLAFFLWSTGPDEPLLALATNGELSDPANYAAQIERMFDDPRSESLVTNFAFQWLGIGTLDNVNPDIRLYPNFDGELRNAFATEMQLFLDSILREPGHSVVELLTAPHSFVNERLARHYGIAEVRGDRFRRIEFEDEQRWGLLGKGAVLMATSYPDRTSPVLRGAWIMDHLIGAPPASPPPGVETNLTPVLTEAPKSVRERLEQHRTQTSCNQCHGIIDPLGQALENFNAIGEWRRIERDSGVPVNPTGRLITGEQVGSPRELREALASDPEQLAHTLADKLMTYALGRRLEYYDLPTVRAIVRESAAENYSFASLVRSVAMSTPFRMRSVPTDDAVEVAQAAGTQTDTQE
jgi:hypothetical protein